MVLGTFIFLFLHLSALQIRTLSYTYSEEAIVVVVKSINNTLFSLYIYSFYYLFLKYLCLWLLCTVFSPILILFIV